MVYRYLRDATDFRLAGYPAFFFNPVFFLPDSVWSPPPPLPGAVSDWITDNAAGYPVSKEVK